MKTLIVIAVLLLVPEGAMAARWSKAEVPVWSFVPDEWQPYVQATVDDFNANLPAAAPRLVYTPMGELPCDALPEYGKQGGISVCFTNDPASGRLGISNIAKRGGRMVHVAINVDVRDVTETPNTLCHEMMHAVTDAPDGTDSNGAYTHPHPDTSCVQGYLGHLGPWDVAYANHVYRHDSDPRHGAGRQHHRAKRGRA